LYKIDKTDLGFCLTFAGNMTKAELERWFEESEQVLTEQQGPFGVIIDMRTLALLSAEAQGVMVRGQSMYRDRGMERSCVILQDAITTIQFMRLARQPGIFKYERYVDASTKRLARGSTELGRARCRPRAVRFIDERCIGEIIPYCSQPESAVTRRVVALCSSMGHPPQ
jgi:hypothetical protein